MSVVHRRKSASSAGGGIGQGDRPGAHGDQQRQTMTGDAGTRLSASSRPVAGLQPVGLRALPRPVAAVVGGGGVLGAAQVGVGYALEQRGFIPDLIIGTSVGAFNGAIAA
ncbi:patatin-like phospholipase family protein, partial [Streptosporangium sp. G11]|uniref:patatin-like phospholipase family protein n=1 Tax=Streptosporangium sp. G11 TaxID=3436926 RepID=UPI003EBD1566